MPAVPSYYISHGSPMTLLENTPCRAYLENFATTESPPRAILSVTAHWETGVPAVSLDEAPDMIYDFGGFPDALYRMTYPAPGAPDVGARAAALLKASGMEIENIAKRGFDHGTWVPLKLMYPNADIPVAQLSVQPGRSPAWHLEVGRALAPLREEGVLIMGSGAMTHNLRAYMSGRYTETPDWVTAFTDWFGERTVQGDAPSLVEATEQAPHYADNHPTDEHLMPFYVALGAALGNDGETFTAERTHASIDYGVLAMDAYRFS